MIVTAEIKPKFLILETGLGGRLDATRCAPADLAILTSITKEHTDILGHDIYQIISEKAAIARPGKRIIAMWAMKLTSVTFAQLFTKKHNSNVSDEINNVGFRWDIQKKV